jgi:hypothetical protein
VSRFDWALSPLTCLSLLCLAGLGQACAGQATENGPGEVNVLGGSGSASGSSSGTGGSGTPSTGGSGTSVTNPSSGGVEPISGSGGTSGDGLGGSGTGDDEAGAGDDSSAPPVSGDDDSGGGLTTPTGSTMPPDIPKPPATCPKFTAGSPSTVNFTGSGGSLGAKVWAGTPKAGGGGALILYWNGTASSPGAEVPICFNTAAIIADGGLVVGFDSSTRTGTTSGNTGDLYWYTSDIPYADQAVACAIQQYGVDPRRIHSAGYSAGALQTVWMTYGRGGYIASAISYSGGDIVIDTTTRQDPSNIPPAIVAHGSKAADDLVANFATGSATWETDIKNAGGFSIDCDDGGSHLAFFTQRGPPLKPVAYQFFKDHPFGIKPEPYKAVPAGYPSYCKLGPQPAM